MFFAKSISFLGPLPLFISRVICLLLLLFTCLYSFSMFFFIYLDVVVLGQLTLAVGNLKLAQRKTSITTCLRSPRRPVSTTWRRTPSNFSTTTSDRWVAFTRKVLESIRPTIFLRYFISFHYRDRHIFISKPVFGIIISYIYCI